VSLLGGIYGAVIGARNRLYDRGFLRARRLAGPVVSVGNISAGGAGKTPFVIVLGELLKQRGVGFDVLSRGYGRSTRGVRLVDPNGSAEECGDEPLMIARRLKCPVEKADIKPVSLRRRNSVRSYTSWTTVFSTVRSPATSTSYW